METSEMNVTKRSYRAPIGSFRCAANRKPLRDGSEARCMRRAMAGSAFCSIHEKARRESIRVECERPLPYGA
jgi:hypothetical protein